MTYEQWYKQLNKKADERFGISLTDLPDLPYADMYTSGMTVENAFHEIERYALDGWE